MDGGPSKVNPPNSHPSNAIHKAAAAESKKEPKPVVKTPATKEPKPVVKTPATKEPKPAVKTPAPKEPTQTVQTEEPVPMAGSGSESHDLNKVAVAVGAVAFAGLAFWTFR